MSNSDIITVHTIKISVSALTNVAFSPSGQEAAVVTYSRPCYVV